MKSPVRVLVFTQQVDRSPDGDGALGDAPCMYCRETVQPATEVGELSDLVTVEVFDIHTNKETAERYGIARVPAIAIVGDKDYGVRYYGIPAGYEFSAFIEDVMDVSRGTAGLSEQNLARLAQINTPMHIQVFVTPTCPYCPPAVRLAHKMAIASDFITADMVEAQEFPELARHYDVMGVPRTVVNETYYFEGAMPEDAAVMHVLRAAGKLSDEDAAAAG